MATVTMTTTLTEVEYADDRFAGVDIDSLLQGGRRTLSFERRRALYEAPEFIQRLSGEETVLEGQSLCIECKIRGFPVPFVRWFKDDEEIIDHPRIHVESDGIGGYFLFIDCITRGDEAAYRCRAENVEGACSSFLFLSVKGKPKRREPVYCPSWRTVSYPPMFSTIVEKVEEEEKQALECEGLPPSPLTEFYYALTLKSRCSWPTFLGAWAFANGGPFSGHQNEEYNEDDDYEEDTENDESDIDDNKFCIPNGDICDNLISRSSNRRHLKAKKNLKRNEIAAREKAKKQKIDTEMDNLKKIVVNERKKDKYEQDGFRECKEKEGRSNNKAKEMNEGVSEKTEMERRLERERQENEEYEKREKRYIEEEEIKIERQNQEESMKKFKNRNNEKDKSNEIIHKENNDNSTRLDREKNEHHKNVNSDIVIRKNREESEQSLHRKGIDNIGIVDKHTQASTRMVEENRNKQRESREEQVSQNGVTFKRNGIKVENCRSETEKKREEIVETVGEVLNSNLSRPVQHADNSQGSVIDRDVVPLPAAVTISKYSVCDDPGQEGQNNKIGDTRFEMNKDLKIRFEKTSSESKNRHENMSKIDVTISEAENYKSRGAGDATRWVSYRNYQSCSLERGSKNNRRQLQHRSYPGQKQAADRDRLEELRQEEERRMLELKQQELDRMEELKQEGAVAGGSLRRNEKIHRYDMRGREMKQIEELRRREQFQREELWQRELKQRDDLRRREEEHKEELKQKGGIVEVLTRHEQQQQEEELFRLRKDLRLKELSQKEDLILRELQHRDELRSKEHVQKEELIVHEVNQIEELRLREWKQIEEIRAKQQTGSASLHGKVERMTEQELEELRMEHRKEQMRKKQLRRQYEEEQKKREEKQTDIKRKREGFVDGRDVYRDATLGLSMRRDMEVNEHVLTNSNLNRSGSSRTPYLSLAKKENEYKLKANTTNRDDTQFSIVNRLDSEMETSHTRSLERSLISSGIFKQNEEYPKPQVTKAENRQQVSKTEASDTGPTKQNSRPQLKQDESTSNFRDKNVVSSTASTTAQFSTPRSFASLFNLNETPGSNSNLLSHHELLELAESIAAEREMFHKSLSQSSHEEKNNLVSFSSVSPLRNNVVCSDDPSVYKQANGSHIGKTGDMKTQDKNNHHFNKRVIRDSQKFSVQPSSLITSGSRIDAGQGSPINEIRSFLSQSSRTVARRLYKKEIQS